MTTKEFPEDVLAGILKIPSYLIGNVQLSTDTSSQLMDSPNPGFCPGRLILKLKFSLITPNGNAFSHIEEECKNSTSAFGGLHLTAWQTEITVPWQNLLITVDAILLKSKETEDIVRSFI